MTWIALLLNYIVGGYAIYRMGKEMSMCYKVNGFGFYFVKFNVLTLVKWAVIVSLITRVVCFLITNL